MARERYLLGGEEETINKPGAEITADTKKSKWDNFWFYHKWHVIIIAAICVLVAWFAHDIISRVDPDYQIALLTKQIYTADMIDSMQNQIAQYGKDLNGDGRVVVQINSYTLSQNDTTSSETSSLQTASSVAIADQQVQQADMIRFIADADSKSSVIFLTDDITFKNQQKTNGLFSYLDGTTPKEDATDYDKMRVLWPQCKLLSQFKINSAQISQSEVQKIVNNLSISMRVYPVSSEKEKEYYNQSKALFNKLVYDK